MKAIVKATGEIIDGSAMVSFNGDDFYLNELEVIQDDSEKTLYDELDEVYWESLKHQYAGVAMQVVLEKSYNELYHTNMMRNWSRDGAEEVARLSVIYATALVEKLKEKSKC